MASDARKTKAQLIEELRELRERLAALEGAAAGRAPAGNELRSVRAPEAFRPPFLRAQDYVQRYFGARTGDPERGTVEFSGERYILVRAASMSVEFYELIASLYAERGEAEARNVANGFLFDIAHALGRADAQAFHVKMNVSDPLEKLSAGPIHFAHSGWAFVDILPDSRPSADEDYYLIYDHIFSFEADSWLRRGRKTDFPVCVMSAGYPSGWCEESFGVPLVAVEVECRARGDEHCRFIMAPPARIEEHLERYRAGAADLSTHPESFTVPEFFQRKRLAEALKDSEERWRSLVANAPNIVIVVDRGGVIQFINRTVPGLSVEEVIGKSHLDYVEPEYRGVATETIESVFRTGETASYRIRGIGPEDSTSWYETHVSPVKRAGQVVAATLFVTDVTERRAAEEALRESEMKYRHLFENMKDAVFLVDPTNGCILDTNLQGEILLGRKREEIINMSQTELHPPSEKEYYRQQFESHIEKEHVADADAEIVRKDGSIVPVSINSSTVMIDGRPVRYGIFREITERRAAEDMARAQNRYNRLRAEIWKLAADGSLSEEDLIQRLLDAIGPELDVSRACYNRMDEKEITCVIEWCAPGVKPSLGIKAPKFVAKFLVRGQGEVITPETALEKIPRSLRPVARPVIESLSRLLDLRSVLAVPCHMGGALEGLVTLDVCGEREDRPAWTDEQKSVVADVVQIISQSITQRRMASAVRRAKEDLERRVAERTAELAAINERLKRELAERERAEQALRDSQERYRSIVEDQTELICRFEPEGILTFVNQAYCRHFNKSSRDLVGRSFLSLIPEEDRDAVLDRLKSLTPENSVKAHEHQVIEPDGSIGWQQWTNRAFFDDEGELVNFQAVGRDITARRRAEEVLAERHAELVRANRELERLHRAKDEFVAMISHELRTPLVTGLGYIELLLEGHLGPASAEATAGMGVALRNLRRLSGMIDDILGYHSLVRSEGRGGPLLVSFDPAEMLRECREEFLVRSGRDGAGVAVDVDADLPAVRADEDMIRRVIANLLDNADRHAGSAAHVRLAARAEGDRVLISVSDDGPGMSEEVQAQVFEPFVKLSGQREGAGLGLAIVRSVLEAHGSEPTLKSAPGRGTEVAFRLPATPRRSAAKLRESKSERLRRIGKEGARVLVVDDDEDTLDLVKLALDGQGYRVRTAPSAESALVLLGEKPADLALVDLSLPGMDGAELCARLKENPATARVPVYMFSARAESSARDRARVAGCDGYIVKPIVMEDFLATVASALKNAI